MTGVFCGFFEPVLCELIVGRNATFVAFVVLVCGLLCVVVVSYLF